MVKTAMVTNEAINCLALDIIESRILSGDVHFAFKQLYLSGKDATGADSEAVSTTLPLHSKDQSLFNGTMK